VTLTFADPSARADLGAFTARLVRLDAMAAVRLRAGRGRVTAWAPTPFETLATRSVEGALEPAELTVMGSVLLTALEVERTPEIDLGAGGAPWLTDLPPDDGWVRLEDDKQTQPADAIAPIVRNDYLAKVDKAAFQKLLDPVSAKIDTATLADLYKQVAVDKKDIKDVAAAWLKANGFVK